MQNIKFDAYLLCGKSMFIAKLVTFSSCYSISDKYNRIFDEKIFCFVLSLMRFNILYIINSDRLSILDSDRENNLLDAYNHSDKKKSRK